MLRTRPIQVKRGPGALRYDAARACSMYTYRLDEAASVAVSLWSGDEAEVDYIEALTALEREDRAAAASGRKHVHITIVAPNFPEPPAIWRKRMAELNRDMHADRYYFAIVTQSARVRGVFTAVRWLIGTRSGHHAVAVSSFVEAASWVRRTTGDPYLQLEGLHRQVRGAALRAEGHPLVASR